MLIALDHIIFGLQRTGGVSRWWRSHVKAVEQAFPHICQLGCYRHQNMVLAEEPIAGYRGEAELPSRWWLRPVECPAGTALFHSSYFRIARRRRGMAVLSSFHDASGFLGRSMKAWAKRRFLGRCLRQADGIHCVSTHAADQLRRVFPDIPGERITVIPNPVLVSDVAERPPSLGHQQEPFVLWVGKRHGYKNAAIAWPALSRLADTHMVCVGGEPLHGAEERELRRQGIAGRVHFLDHIPTAHLTWLYKNARALWYPSLNEGFGYPPLEAALYDCPVLAASGHGVEEMCGDLAVITDCPTAEWLAGATRVLNRGLDRTRNLPLRERFGLDAYREAMRAWYERYL